MLLTDSKMSSMKHALDYASAPPRRRAIAWVLLAVIAGCIVSRALLMFRREVATREAIRQALIARRAASGAAAQTRPVTQP